MSISTRGIEYKVSVTVGRSAQGVTALTKSLRDLETATANVRKLFRAIGTDNNSATAALYKISGAIDKLAPLFSLLGRSQTEQATAATSAATAANSLAAANAEVAKSAKAAKKDTDDFAQSIAKQQIALSKNVGRAANRQEAKERADGAKFAAQIEKQQVLDGAIFAKQIRDREAQETKSTANATAAARNAAQRNTANVIASAQQYATGQSKQYAQQVGQQYQQMVRQGHQVGQQLGQIAAQQAQVANPRGGGGGIGGLGAFGAIAGVFGGAAILDAIKHVTILAGRVQNLSTVMQIVGKTASISKGELFATEQQMRQLGVTTQVSREIITRFAQYNLSMADSLRIVRIAQDAAVVSGINSSEAAERLVLSIQRLDTRLLRNQGLLVNLRSEYQRFTLETGRAENSLSAEEKQHILLNAVLKAGTRLTGAYAGALQDVYKQFTSLDRKIEEASRTVGENFIPHFTLLVSLSTKLAEAMKDSGNSISAFTSLLLSGAGLAGVVAIVLGLAAGLAAVGATVVAILAAAAAVGVLVQGIVLYENAQKAAVESATKNAEVAAHQRFEINSLTQTIEKLLSIKDRSVDQNSQLAKAEQELLSNLTEEEIRWYANARAMGDYEAIRLRILRNGVPVSNSDIQTIHQLGVDLENLKKKRQELDANPETDELGYSFGNGGKDKVDEQIAAKKAAIDAVTSESTAARIKAIEDLAHQTDSLAQQAEHAQKSFEKLELDGLGPELKAVLETSEAMSELSGQMLRAADIQEKLKSEQDAATKTYNEYLKTLEGDNSDAAVKKRVEATAAYNVELAGLALNAEKEAKDIEVTAAARAQGNRILSQQIDLEQRTHAVREVTARLDALGVKGYTEALLKMQQAYVTGTNVAYKFNQDIIDTQKKIADLQALMAVDASGEKSAQYGQEFIKLQDDLRKFKANLQSGIESQGDLISSYAEQASVAASASQGAVNDLVAATMRLRKENELLGLGISKDVIDKLMQAQEEEDKFEKTIAGLATAIVAAQEAVVKAKTDLKNAGSDADRKNAQNKLDAVKKHLDDLMAAEDAYQQKRIDASAESTKKITEDLVKSEKEAADKIEDITKGIIEKRANTAEGILKSQIDRGAFGNNTPAVSAGFDLLKKIEGMVRGAGGVDQIGTGEDNTISGEFEANFQRTFGAPNRDRKGNVIGNGIRETLYRDISGKLNAAAAERTRELEKQDKQLNEAINLGLTAKAQLALLAVIAAKKLGNVDAVKALLNPAALQEQKDLQRKAEEGKVMDQARLGATRRGRAILAKVAAGQPLNRREQREYAVGGLLRHGGETAFTDRQESNAVARLPRDPNGRIILPPAVAGNGIAQNISPVLDSLIQSLNADGPVGGLSDSLKDVLKALGDHTTAVSAQQQQADDLKKQAAEQAARAAALLRANGLR